MVRKLTNTANVIGSILRNTLCSPGEGAGEGPGVGSGEGARKGAEDELDIWFLVVGARGKAGAIGGPLPYSGPRDRCAPCFQIRSIATAAASSAAAMSRICCSVRGPRASRNRSAIFRLIRARMISGAGPPPWADLTDRIRSMALSTAALLAAR